ncbi:MAG: hypothetical protein WCG85_11120 [Polyangia bacterium]
MQRAWIAVWALSISTGCVGQTGGQTVDFDIAAAGPADAVAGQPLAFTSSAGWDVVLVRATLHIGAVYLDESRPISGGQATGCYLTGTYVAQETSGLDVDLLNPGLQMFPAQAHGITEPTALIGQVWLTGGDINASTDATPILVVAGTATQAGATGGLSFPFTGTVTISSNHQTSSSGAAGGDPICRARIVTPIDAVPIQTTGGLLLRIDPRVYFAGVDFSQLPVDASAGSYAFSDNPNNAGYSPTGYQLYTNLHQTAPYTFSWTDSL